MLIHVRSDIKAEAARGRLGGGGERRGEEGGKDGEEGGTLQSWMLTWSVAGRPRSLHRIPPSHATPFFRLIVPVGRSPIGVAFGILWNGGVVRVNVAALKGVAFGIARTITKRMDLTSGSSLGFRFRPHNCRYPNSVAIAKKGPTKSVRPARLTGRTEDHANFGADHKATLSCCWGLWRGAGACAACVPRFSRFLRQMLDG